MDDLINRKGIVDTVCEGISCNECSFNEIDGESGCLLAYRIDQLPSAQKTGKKTDDLIKRQDAIDAICQQAKYANGDMAYLDAISNLPSAQKTGEWTNHEVACLLADLFNDTCACNYNDIDEWLPKYCEVIDDCPNPVGVACWEQFLRHRARMKGEE